MQFDGPAGESLELTMLGYTPGGSERLLLSVRFADQGQQRSVDTWLNDQQTLRLANWLLDIGRTEAIPPVIRFREAGVTIRLMYCDGHNLDLNVRFTPRRPAGTPPPTVPEADLFSADFIASLNELDVMGNQLKSELAKLPPL